MLNYRKFENETDYDIMRKLVQLNCAELGHLYPQVHIGNLDFERYAFFESPDIFYKVTWLVFKEEQPIGFIMSDEDEFSITILEEFVKYTEGIINFIEKNCYPSGGKVTTEANSEDSLLNGILMNKGYTKTEDFRFSGFCDLANLGAIEALPEGFKIRATEIEDVARRVELFGLATGGSRTSPARYVRMMNSPSYADALDLVVCRDDGEVIAYCTLWNDPISRTAILEPVACVEEYRRRGIMKSTLLYGMKELQKRGTKYIYVGTGGKNIPSQTLYKSVGFIERGKKCEWEKTIF